MAKTTITILITCIFCFSILLGQENELKIGIETGPSLISIRGNDLANQNQSQFSGYAGGLTLQYSLHPNFSVKTNLAYERKGARSTAEITDPLGALLGETTYIANFDYLTIPVLGHFSFGENVRIFANFGPYLGFLLKQANITKPYNNVAKIKENNIDNFKRLDWGLTAGLGGGIAIKENIFLTLEVRHNLGLHSISKVRVFNDGKVLTRSTNFLLGVAYLISEE